MIEVSLSTSDSKILSMNVTGHAKSAKRGQDLVCASVSSIATGALNALDRYAPGVCVLQLQDDENARIDIQVRDIQNNVAQIILQTVLTQLETIENNYSKYIHITKQEV
jgi:uncharacterized protein